MPFKTRLGNLDLAVLSDGQYFVDAGAAFGIVPRALWESHAPDLDDHHRIPLGMNCLLLRSGDKLILIEAGVGDKPGGRRFASPAERGNLLSDLAALDVRPGDIDVVINTHLHADHCGWNTRIVDDTVVPTFPRAEYLISRMEWLAAVEPDERTRATYLADNFHPLADAGLLRLIAGETKVTDEVTIIPTPGHSEGHCSVVIASGGETAIYIGDIAQVGVQLERTAWVSAFDILPQLSMDTKRRLVQQAVDQQSLIIGVHLPFPGLGHMTPTGGGARWTPLPGTGAAS